MQRNKRLPPHSGGLFLASLRKKRQQRSLLGKRGRPRLLFHGGDTESNHSKQQTCESCWQEDGHTHKHDAWEETATLAVASAWTGQWLHMECRIHPLRRTRLPWSAPLMSPMPGQQLRLQDVLLKVGITTQPARPVFAGPQAQLSQLSDLQSCLPQSNSPPPVARLRSLGQEG